jgi:hypothetical protein
LKNFEENPFFIKISNILTSKAVKKSRGRYFTILSKMDSLENSSKSNGIF